MTAMKLYKLLIVFISAVNVIIQGLLNETITFEQAHQDLDRLLTDLQAEMDK